MSKEKTEYRFSVHAAPAVINQVIQNYLAANQYVQMPKPNANYYFFNDNLFATIILSYRQDDIRKWETDFSNIIKTFKWNNKK